MSEDRIKEESEVRRIIKCAFYNNFTSDELSGIDLEKDISLYEKGISEHWICYTTPFYKTKVRVSKEDYDKVWGWYTEQRIERLIETPLTYSCYAPDFISEHCSKDCINCRYYEITRFPKAWYVGNEQLKAKVDNTKKKICMEGRDYFNEYFKDMGLEPAEIKITVVANKQPQFVYTIDNKEMNELLKDEDK